MPLFDVEIKMQKRLNMGLCAWFLPAAKPTGHRTVRVVVVVVVGGGDYFEVMTLELTLSQGQLFLVKVIFIFPPPSCSPTLNFLRGGIRRDQSGLVSHRVLSS